MCSSLNPETVVLSAHEPHALLRFNKLIWPMESFHIYTINVLKYEKYFVLYFPDHFWNLHSSHLLEDIEVVFSIQAFVAYVPILRILRSMHTVIGLVHDCCSLSIWIYFYMLDVVLKAVDFAFAMSNWCNFCSLFDYLKNMLLQ